ncbi:MAG TPA: hypothetical protein VG407_13550 [Caulobacteraceae bacterium]|jgi:holdfast attachment protein HfaA|nr:hypothetical protein [Caulobacteraceae bacterium]
MTRNLLGLAAGLTLAAAGLSGVAQAQSLSTSAAAFNAGFGRTFGQENRPVDLDGRLTTLADASLLSLAPENDPAPDATAGVADLSLGASDGGMSLVPADHLVVLTQGNWRTKATASVQAGADASASADLNGKIDLNGPN